MYWGFTGGLLDTGLVDRILPDQVLTGGVAMSGGGFTSPGFVDIMELDFISGAQGTICIDSAFFPPSADWLMVPDGPPTWLGGGGDLSVGGSSPTAFCLTSAPVFGEGACFFPQCSGALTVRGGDTVRYQYTLDSDTPTAYNHTATTDGAGQLSIDSIGIVTYVPDTADYGKSIFIDASFTIPGEPFLCAPADTTVCNCVTFITITNPPRNCCDVPGDADHNGSVNVADVTFLIARIFNGGPEPFCVNEADINADGKINISDITFLIARVFADSPAPVCGSVL